MIIGLTGQTGAGKTTVSQLLRERGFHVIDADIVARLVVEKGTRCLTDLVLEFGVGILDSGGGLDRRKMGNLIWDNKPRRMRFNEIVFPYIQEEIQAQTRRAVDMGNRVVFLDAPTLFESGSESFCDKVVSVTAPKEVRRKRLLERDAHRTMEEIDNRIEAQHDDAFYALRSDFVIRNGGEMTGLRVQVLEMLEFCCRGVERPDKGLEA